MESTHAAVWDFWRSVSILGGVALFGFLAVIAAAFRKKWPLSAVFATLAYMLAVAYMVGDQASRFGDGDITWRLPVFVASEILGIMSLRILWKRKKIGEGFVGDDTDGS